MSLARRFSAGIGLCLFSSRSGDGIRNAQQSLRDGGNGLARFPALKRRAKLMPTLRVEQRN
ncbi:MAG TPA: hypothetical protein VGW76_01270 [Pyrinomonadaceae bacterium]|nr:hypothetical protein [Pyrinomonadaceae bacterium]